MHPSDLYNGPLVIGPTFGQEVIDAGLGGLPFSWSLDGTFYGRENLTAEQNTTLDAVFAAHNPTLTAVPQTISARQFYQELAVYGDITQQQALDAVRSGTLPPLIADFISSLSADQQFTAQMQFSGGIAMPRHETLVEMFFVWDQWTSAEVDDFFREAANL